MPIRVERNESGNCVNFHGSSNPTYWNACLSAYVDSVETDTINIVNDIITSQTGITEYEYYRIPYTEFVRADNTSFANATEAAAYITQAARVIGVGAGGTGVDLTGEVVSFSLDDTSTSIVFDVGYSYGVNTIKAVASGGLIEIHTISGDRTLFGNLAHTNVRINEAAPSGGLNDIVNILNELFSVGAFTSVVISDPHATLVADVNGVTSTYSLHGSGAYDPIGDDIFGNLNNSNAAALKSTETINQAGEYFTFDIRLEGRIGVGLAHTTASWTNGYYSGNGNVANPAQLGVMNQLGGGLQFGLFFDSSTDGALGVYGAQTNNTQGPGWTSWEAQNEWLAGDPVKVRVGIDANGYFHVDTLQDDGTTWVQHVRSTYAAKQFSEFHLAVKCADNIARMYSAPKVHHLEDAPTMYFRYIESPDGNFEYPLFATAEEANYYDEENGGSGTSHTHTYADDPTATTWYMPDTNSTMTATSAPQYDTTLGLQATYTEITSLTNADLVPPAFSQSDITQAEGTAINMQLMPAGATWSQSVTISPSGSGLVYNTSTHYLQGTLTDVGADTDYTITVTRANSYGSSVGSFVITATDVTPSQTHTTAWTKALDFSGGSEYAEMVSGAFTNKPIAQDLGVTITSGTNGNTSNDTNSDPWACACVFKVDGNSSNQHIWNQGEGGGSTDDNIYLRLDASQNLYFGWGRSGALNELYIDQINTTDWYGVYIAYDGRRASGANATPANLAEYFDVYMMSSADSFASIGSNYSTSTNWSNSSSTTGGRMDRVVSGSFTIGGRGNNRSFHGKVASFVATTLRQNVAMPTTAEALEMITDPKDWMTNYKVGNAYRKPQESADTSNWQIGTTGSSWDPANATQVWIMGDGLGDSYNNKIRNQAYAGDQYVTKLDMLSMVSNDIETVNISGLT